MEKNSQTATIEKETSTDNGVDTFAEGDDGPQNDKKDEKSKSRDKPRSKSKLVESTGSAYSDKGKGFHFPVLIVAPLS